jgi:hypothetical protein
MKKNEINIFFNIIKIHNITMENLGHMLLESISISMGDTNKYGWWCCSCGYCYENKPEICTNIIESKIDFEKLLPVYNEYLTKSNGKIINLDQLISEYNKAEEYVESSCGYVVRNEQEILNIADISPDIWINKYCNSSNFKYEGRDCSTVIDKYHGEYLAIWNELLKNTKT